MFNELKNKIKNKSLVLFGEIHGTKEIPEFLLKFFSEIAKEEDFDICLEIPRDFERNIEKFFIHRNKEDNDGRASLEYLNLIRKIPILNKKYERTIKIHCIDIHSETPIDEKNFQNQRESIMAKQILDTITNKKLFVVFGSVHASKKSINIGNKKIRTAGSILHNSVKDRMMSILFHIKSGTYFNFGLKKIQKGDKPAFYLKGFDHILIIPKSSPATFA